MATPYPHLRHESTRISDAIDGLENGIITGTASAGLWAAKKTAKLGWGATKLAGKVGLTGASLLGTGSVKAASGIGRVAVGSIMSKNPLKNPVGVLAKTAYKIGDAMVDYRGAETVYNTTKKKLIHKAPSLKLSKIGAGVILGGSLLSGAMSSYNKFMQSRLGTIDAKATTTNPDYTPQEYSRTMAPPPDDAGATGDLVFALFKNRRGGSML